MMHKIKEWCDKPLIQVSTAVLFAAVGAVVGIFAYYGHWLGKMHQLNI